MNRLLILTGMLVLSCIGNSVSAGVKNLLVYWEYYPQMVQVADAYNAMPGNPDKVEVIPTSQPPEWSHSDTICATASAAGARIDARVADDRLIPDSRTARYCKTPIWYNGLILFANRDNPFLDKLGKKELTPEQVKRLWTGSVTWEELAGIEDGKHTPVKVVSNNRIALERFTQCKQLTSRDTGQHFQPVFLHVREDKYGLGCIEIKNSRLTLLDARYLERMYCPLMLEKLHNGKYRLYPSRAENQTAAFAGVVRSGNFIKIPFNILTSPKDKKLGTDLAEAAKRLGAETVFNFGYYPLDIALKPQKQALPKFVFAHAMHCYLFGAIGMTSRNKVPEDDFARWPDSDRNFRAWWSKPYSALAKTQSLAASRTDLDLAQEAGLDALGILLDPRSFIPGFYAGIALENIIRAAETHQVKIIPDIWGFYNVGAEREERRVVLNFLARHLVAMMEKYPHAFYKYNGKYVICMGQPVRRGNYPDIEPLFNLFGGRDNVFLIAGMSDLPSQNRASGWVDGPDMLTAFEVHLSWGDRVLEHILVAEKKRGKQLCWPVSTAMYTNTGDLNRTFMAESLGACTFIDRWREALALHSRSVYIATWNDFSEDTHITCSNYRGDTFMRLNRYFSDWFRTDKPPAITQERLFIFHHRQLVDANITEGKWRAKERPWHTTPQSDYIHIVSMLKQAGTLELKLGDRTLKQKVPAGFHEWLVYVPRKKQYTQPDWNRGSYVRHYPVADANRDVTQIDVLKPCKPVVTLERDGKKLGSVAGRTDIPGTARFSDLCVVGNSGPVGQN